MILLRGQRRGLYMVQVILDIPNNDLQRVLDAFCDNDDYRKSGLSQADYSKAKVIEFVKNTVRTYEHRKAHQIAVSSIVDVPVS